MNRHNRVLPEALRQDDSIRAKAKLDIGLSDFQHCAGNIFEGLARFSKATTRFTCYSDMRIMTPSPLSTEAGLLRLTAWIRLRR